MRRHLVLLFVVLLWFHLSVGLKNKLKISDDNRKTIFIESFGYVQRGVMNLQVNFSKGASNNAPTAMAFVVKKTDTDANDFDTVPYECPIVTGREDEFDPIVINDFSVSVHKTIEANEEGIYSLFFVNCPASKVSFRLELEQYNVDAYGRRDYLSIGYSPIPTIYGMFSIAYIILLVVWIFAYMRAKEAVLNKVHYLMSVLIFLKFFSMLSYGIEQHYLKKSGTDNEGWEYTYYVFAVLKTGFFFVIVTLIGTGWTFFKPFLSDKDKKIIMVVIPLQILDNIAMVYVNTNQPGKLGWIAWKDIFRLVDIICCGAILIPIIWSIKHLREASQSDGKAALNLRKLRLFRQFYLIVVSYIYFTRIIIYLLDATLPFKLLFLGDVFTELATITFFMVVGYKFRPMKANPYFNVEEEDAVRMEELRNGEILED